MAPRRKRKVDGVDGPSTRDGERYMAPHDVYKLLAYERDVALSTLKIQQLDTLVAKIRAESELLARDKMYSREATARELAKKVGALTTLQKHIATAYGVEDSSSLTYDDETGRITSD